MFMKFLEYSLPFTLFPNKNFLIINHVCTVIVISGIGDMLSLEEVCQLRTDRPFKARNSSGAVSYVPASVDIHSQQGHQSLSWEKFSH